jgi:DNA repair exonuclease SbcCD ATPase subunit
MTEQAYDDIDAAFNDAMQDSDDSADQGEQHQSADTGSEETELDIQDDGEQQQQMDDAAEQDDTDPWQSVPEPLRNQFQQTNQALQKLQSDYQAVTGRLAPTQRELDALKKKLAEQEQLKETGKKDGPTADEIEAMSDDELKREWPEVAAALERREQQLLSRIEAKLNPLQQQMEQRQQFEQQQQEQQIRQQELNRLAQAHPDYQDVVRNPGFKQWVDSQHPSIQALKASMSADDNIALLNLYKQTTGATAKPAAQRKPNNLSDHVTTSRKGAGAPIAVRRGESDFESEFDFAMRNG